MEAEEQRVLSLSLKCFAACAITVARCGRVPCRAFGYYVPDRI